MPPKSSSPAKAAKKKTMTKKAKAAYVKRAFNQKQDITNRVWMKTGRNIRGQGAYTLSDLWDTVSTPFRHGPQEGSGKINNMVRGGAEMLGKELTGSSTVGRYLGNAASWFTKLMGSGTYSIKGNSVMNGPDPAIATFKPNAATIISHREFVADVTGSTTFANTGYLLNPGNKALFPWLATLALNYEQYEWLGLAFEFRSTCAFTSATGNLGAVVMATDYDVLDVDFDSKRAMEIADFSGSSSPVNSFYHFIECSPKQNVLRQMYVQQGNDAGAYPDDPRFSIPGRFQLGTQGMPSAFIIGELWVTYHVKLTKPTIAPALADSLSTWARYQAIILPSNLIAPPLVNTGGSSGLGLVSPWNGGSQVQGLTFTGFQPGDYVATIIAKRAGTDNGTTTEIGGTGNFTGGGSNWFTGYNSSLVQQAEPLSSRNVTGVNGGYEDTQMCIFSFTVTATTSVAQTPVPLWNNRNNGVTVIVTKTGSFLDGRKSRIDRKIQDAVEQALCQHGKDETNLAPVQKPKFVPHLEVVEEGDDIAEPYYAPKFTRQDASSGLMSSSSRSNSNKK